MKRKGITPNAIKEKLDNGASPTSKLIDLDNDPNDLSMEEDYLSNLQYETDVLSLPIEERRAIQKQRMIAEYMLKIGKADIDGVESNSDLIEDDGDWVKIDGEMYRID
jgi:hypothetical protein